MANMRQGRLAALVVAALAAGCGGGGGGTGVTGLRSTFAGTVNGSAVGFDEMTTGVDAAGGTFVLASGSGGAFEVRFAGTAPGTFTQAGTDGAKVIYTDASGKTFEASDVTPDPSDYAVTITTSASGHVAGTLSATVVASDGASRTVTATFDVVRFTGVTGTPYEGTYLGIFRAVYQLWDPTLNDGSGGWGPQKVTSFRVTITLDHVGTTSDAYAYLVTRARVTHPAFGTGVAGVTPDLGSGASLPKPPGSGGASFTIWFPNDEMLVFGGAAGDVYTSSTGAVLSSALGETLGWQSADGGPWETALDPGGNGLLFVERTWSLTISAY